ncbi:MAG TPA: class I SAM-dependent methyltransferase [Bryobacteraceae bacterium]|nr:class I SAM-dependent methyltransferase [Bryobacteraceae bacterium]
MAAPANTESRAGSSNEWEQVGARKSPSWYLDPLVAAQKRRVHQELVWRWTRGVAVRRVLKTDSFEEAHGDDCILFDLFPPAYSLGMDLALSTARRAQSRCPSERVRFLVSDARSLAVRPESMDAIVSTSTLDHFDTRAEFERAIGQLAGVLRPGGVLVITLDNPRNPLYCLLRWASRRDWLPFRLGYTTALPGLARCLEDAGLEVTATGALIHNPRMVSTLLFRALRLLLGRRADGPIRGLLEAFATLERLPTRRFTACFVAVCARKPEARPAGLCSAVSH